MFFTLDDRCSFELTRTTATRGGGNTALANTLKPVRKELAKERQDLPEKNKIDFR